VDIFSLREKAVPFQALTGLTPPEFDSLLPVFEECLERHQRLYSLHKKKRKITSFRQHKSASLPLSEEKLFFILVYYKSYPLLSYHAAAFGLSIGKTSEWVTVLEPVLLEALNDLGVIPQRDAQVIPQTVTDVLLIDATERPIVRNKDKQAQKEEYSGKSKQHSVKNNIVATTEGQIRWLSETYPGSVHDKKIMDEEPIELRKDQKLLQDTGFQGHQPSEGTILQPEKKKRKTDDR
jgi:hypothetical protein